MSASGLVDYGKSLTEDCASISSTESFLQSGLVAVV